MKIKPKLIWDWDGTLVDSLQYKYEDIWDEVFYGEPKRAACVKEFIKTPEGKSVNRYGLIRFALVQDGLPEVVQLSSEAFREYPVAKNYADRYDRASKELIRRNGLFEGVKDMLERLYKNGYPMYIISGGGTNEDLKCMADNLGIGGYFRGIFGFCNAGASLVSFGKHENFGLVMESEQDTDPSRYIVIGDGETDKRFAEEVACEFIGIANAWNTWNVEGNRIVASPAGVEEALNTYQS